MDFSSFSSGGRGAQWENKNLGFLLLRREQMTTQRHFHLHLQSLNPKSLIQVQSRSCRPTIIKQEMRRSLCATTYTNFNEFFHHLISYTKTVEIQLHRQLRKRIASAATRKVCRISSVLVGCHKKSRACEDLRLPRLSEPIPIHGVARCLSYMHIASKIGCRVNLFHRLNKIPSE